MMHAASTTFRSARRLLVLAGLALVMPGAASGQVTVGGARFDDLGATSAANPTRRINLGAPRGSIGVIDYDGDGYYDLFFNDGVNVTKKLFHNVPSPTTPGGRNFVDVSVAAGIATDADLTSRASGTVVVFDYNNDGFPDIYTGGGSSPRGAGLLLRNNGDGTFTNVTDAARVRSPLLPGLSPDSASAVDVNHDGFLDLLVDNVGSSTQTFTLLLNNGDGTFANRSDLVTQPGFSGRIYASAWTDLDHDGWEDHVALLSNGVGLVLRNTPDGTGGRRLTALAPTQSGLVYLGPAPMGIALGDYDGDGWVDLAVTDAAVGTYYRNDGGRLTRITPFSTFFGWGTTWLDTSNRGRLDNYQAGSYGASNIDQLWLNGGGTWTNGQTSLNTTSLPSQHCARVDFDNDGLEDLVTINQARFVSVYRNTAPEPGHWLRLRLGGSAGGPGRPAAVNSGAVGAVVRVTAGGVTQVRELVAGSSFGATEDPRAHFGLGSSTTVERIEIVWPRAGSLAERTQVFTGPFGVDRQLTLRPSALAPAELTASLPDYNADGFVNLDDLADFVTDYYTVPAIPGGAVAAAPTRPGEAVGFGTPCPLAADAPPPYAADAYRSGGFRVGFSVDGSNACPLDPAQPFPNLDHLGDFVGLFYGQVGS